MVVEQQEYDNENPLTTHPDHERFDRHGEFAVALTCLQAPHSIPSTSVLRGVVFFCLPSSLQIEAFSAGNGKGATHHIYTLWALWLGP